MDSLAEDGEQKCTNQNNDNLDDCVINVTKQS